MEVNRKLLSFRYKKYFLINRLKLKKNKFSTYSYNIKSHDACPLCSSKEAFLISEVDRVGFLCNTVMCKECDFVFNNSYISEPNDLYEKHFGADRWGDPEKNFIRRTSLDSYSWKRFSFLLNILNGEFSKIERVLEIGCGDGCNLMPYHFLGKSVMGCDFSLPFLEPGLKRGLNLIQGDVDSIKEKENFDLIMLIHSLEHVIDLDMVVQSISERLSKGGFVFIEVPGVIGWNQARDSYSKEMGLESSNNFLQYLQFEHNYHFSLKHLVKLFERHDFELVYGDEWVRAIFQKKNNYNEINKIKIDSSSIGLFNHLKLVEKDYLKLNNLILGLVRRLLKIMSSKK